jgi:D-alanine-D-alanine ligase
MGSRVFVYVFIPYCLNNGQLESPDYDTPATWAELANAFDELSITWKWQPVTFENLDGIIEKMTLSQHKEGSIVLNFCDGDEINGFPGISVVRKLEAKGIVFSGANSNYYHKTTSKILMKENFEREHVSTAPYRAITDLKKDIRGLCADMGTPLIVKPAISAASWGITLKSIVYTDEEILIQVEELLKGCHGTVFTEGEIFAEKFIKGPEFTVFIVGSSNRPEGLNIYHPVERAFHEGLPPMERLLSYERYWGLYEEEAPLPLGQALYTYRLVEDEDLKERICDLALRAYMSVDGCGYGRVDIRLDNESGELFVLEVNSNCGISSDDQTSVGQILRLSGASYTHLLSEILNDAVIRHEGEGKSKL